VSSWKGFDIAPGEIGRRKLMQTLARIIGTTVENHGGSWSYGGRVILAPSERPTIHMSSFDLLLTILSSSVIVYWKC